MLIEFLRTHRLSKRIIFKLGEGRARFLVDHFRLELGASDKILDIGSGTGNIVALLRADHLDVTPLDVQNLSFTDNVVPLMYDGGRIPFEDKSFDVALLITVLHHIAEPEPVIAEAARVARRVIIVEDVYHSPLHKRATHFFDSLFNLEFRNHPHSNKNDEVWQKLFKEMGLTLTAEAAMKSFVVFRHKLYVLDVTR